jgi:hypothetical protein
MTFATIAVSPGAHVALRFEDMFEHIVLAPIITGCVCSPLQNVGDSLESAAKL